MTITYLCPTCCTPVLELDDPILNAALGRTCHLCDNPLDGSANAHNPMLVLLATDGYSRAMDAITHLLCSLPAAMQPRPLSMACADTMTPTELHALRTRGAVIWHITSATNHPLGQHCTATLLDNGNTDDLHAQVRTAWGKVLMAGAKA
jgi:hypothetical protein